VNGLTNGTGYTFTVTATNAIGTGTSSTPSASVTPGAIAPGVPTSISASGGNVSATVSFTAPTDNGGSAITGYTVTSTPVGGGAAITATGASSSITVTGLTNGTSYTFTVTATNSAGTGTASSASGAVTPAAIAPGVPTGIGASGGNNSALVSFTAPTDNGGAAISSYTVTSSPGGFTATGTLSPITVIGLTNGTLYTFTVTATNSVGTSASSTASAPVIPAITAPGAPTIISASGSNGRAIVSFTAPTNAGGSPITQYTVTSSPGSFTASGTSSPIAVAGLANGTPYTFTVTATNSLGTGTASSASSSVSLPITAPGAPTGIAATVGNAIATVSFTPPANNGGATILSYTVTATPVGGGTPITGTGASSSITVTGLTNGTAYTFSVTATNSVGTSTSSTPSAAVTPAATAPSVPTIISAIGSNGSATVTFAATGNNGGSAITGFTVTATSVRGRAEITATGTNSPITVTGLANGTSYTLTVTATDAAGTSTSSTPSSAVTPAPIAPGAPTGIAATGGNGSAEVSFTPPASTGGSAITGYTVTSSPGGITATGTSSPITVIGLTGGLAYTFTVTATNAVGAGTSSTTSVSVNVAEKLAQTIGFNQMADRASDAGSFELSATASSGLPVTWAIMSGPALLAGSTVDLTGAAGLVVIRAAQPGNLIYDAAPEVTRTFTVSAPMQTVYFGTVSSAGSTVNVGDVAAVLPPGKKQGTLLIVAPAVGVNTVLEFTLNPDGTFNQTITIATAPALVRGAGTERLPGVAAAPMTLTVRGSLVNGRLQGVIEPLGLAFSALMLPTAGPSAGMAGFYDSSNLAAAGGETYSVVGTNNEVLVLATTPGVTTGGLTTLAANGTFSLQTQTPGGTATIRGAVDEPTTTVSGSITLPGQAETDFAGLRTTTTRTDRLINLSSRVRIGSGGNVLITGFVIGGAEAKQVLIRGIGPALAGLGVQGTLANPQLRIYRGSEVVAQNDDWSTGADSAALAGAFQRLGAFALAPGSKDAALFVALAPGAYTAHILTDGAGGVALAEIYDASPNPNAEYQRLINISSRGDVGTGENILIGGFIVTGNAPKKMLIRAIGPGLTAFGVAGALADPRLGIFNSATRIAENDNWSAASAEAAATAQAARDTGAFALANGSKDAALILTLAPGAYTAQVSGADGTSTGVALIEVYEVP
jgi:hypothetical protein